MIRPKSRRHCCLTTPPPLPPATRPAAAAAEELPTTAAPSHLGASASPAPTWMPADRGMFGFRSRT